MPYIKISDPNIIDLSAWQQVINVINQHSDTLSAITNNFGLQGSVAPDWNGETEIYEEFNSGSQKMIYGKIRIDTTGDNKDTMLHTNNMFYQRVEFSNTESGTSGFSAKPIVLLTPAIAGTYPTITSRNAGLVCTVSETKPEGFTARVIKSREFLDDESGSAPNAPKPNRYFDINWIAIGPK
jgi:hypothetical protein